MLATAPTVKSRVVSIPVEGEARSPSAIDLVERENLTELDARTPSPPKVVPAVLAALRAIPPGCGQFVRTANAPTELLRDLQRHGVAGRATQLPDGSWRTLLLFTTTGTTQ